MLAVPRRFRCSTYHGGSDSRRARRRMLFRHWCRILLVSGHIGSSTSTGKIAEPGRAGGLCCILQVSTGTTAEVLPPVSALVSAFNLGNLAASHPADTGSQGHNDPSLDATCPFLDLRKRGNCEEVSTRTRCAEGRSGVNLWRPAKTPGHQIWSHADHLRTPSRPSCRACGMSAFRVCAEQ